MPDIIPRAERYATLGDLKQQGKLQYDRLAFEVPGTQKPGQTGHYRNAIWSDASVLESGRKPRTLYQLVKQVTDEIPNDNALGYLPVLSKQGDFPVVYGGEYKWFTYGEVEIARMEIGSGLMHLYRNGALGKTDSIEKIDAGAGPEQGWGVGIWCGNRPEWQMIDMATQAFGLVSCALYDTLGPNTTVYVSNHAQLPIIFLSLRHLPSMLKILPSCPTVKVLVCMDFLPTSSSDGTLARDWAASQNVKLFDLAEFRRLGKEKLIGPMEPSPERVATLCYTSGTTGNPKGAILTHRNMTTAVIANAYGTSFPDRGTIECSYLPLAHVYGRFIDLLTVYIRGAAAYTTGDTSRLLQDVKLIRPNFFPSVPRVLNRIYGAIKIQAESGGLKGNLLKHAIDVKVQRFRQTGDATHALYDRLVFSKVRDVMGGQLLYHTSGSAPIAKEVFETLKVTFGVDSIEGWGMTETVGTGSTGWPNDPGATGTIGPPRLINDFKLIDVPEMGYLSTDKPVPRGELCVKGSNVFSGYYKDENNTKEALDDEGWLHTGDVCSVDSAGRFKIIDRRKNLVKLSQGEYVAIETVENLYQISPLFSTFFLYGNSLKSHLVAIGVVDPTQLLAFIKKHHGARFKIRNEEELGKVINGGGTEARRLRQAVVENLKVHGKAKGLNGYELVKGIHLMTDPFSPDLITPSFKFKRQAVQKQFKDQLEQAYDESEEPLEDNPAKAKAKL